MPGSTNNTDLLQAQNQTIQALNDIERAIRDLNLCGCGSTQPPQPSIGPGDPPPPGTSLPIGDVQLRRCKAAIFLVDYYLRPLTYTLDLLQFEALMSVGSAAAGGAAGAAISALAASPTGPGAIIAGAAGGVVGARRRQRRGKRRPKLLSLGRQEVLLEPLQAWRLFQI